MKRLFTRINAVTFVYIFAAVATAAHTAWGAAVTMQGAMPEDPQERLIWGMWGLLYAIGIDAAMIVVASKLHASTSRRAGLYVTFAVAALISAYFQLIYAFAHSTPIISAGGISTQHTAAMQTLVDLRVWVAPFALPLIVTLFSLTGIVHHKGERKQHHSGVNDEIAVTVEPTLDTPQTPKLTAGKRVCPGCGVEQSNLSRHKKTCAAYQQMIMQEVE